MTPQIVASGDFSGTSGGTPTLAAYTDSGLGGVYRLGAYADATGSTGAGSTIQATWVDEFSNTQTFNLGTNMIFPGVYLPPDCQIRLGAGQTITIVLAGFGLTGDFGATIEQLR